MCCGSPLAPELKRRFAEAFGCHLIELYGLTEGLFTILAPEDFDRKLLSVGKPVLGADLRIIGADGGEAAPGEIGEVVGRSRVMMAGYLNREQDTREAIWVDAAGRQWLRTGDLGRLDADGFLYIVDRLKDMILSGSQNIYPADIEAVMRAHPAVAEVAVVGVPSAEWGETPVAVVVPAAGQAFDPPALLSWTNARVGRQQRVRAVVAWPALPRNPNGKILKRDLRRELSELGIGMNDTLGMQEYWWPSKDGLKLYARRYETAGAAAPAVLCLPGLTRNSRDFEALAQHLAPRYRLICPDLRGRGFSARDPVWQNYQPATYLADLSGLISALGLKRFAIVGTSLGGMLAMMLPAALPGSVAGIVLNDIGPEIDPIGAERIRGYAGRLGPVGNWAEAVAQLQAVYGTAWPGLTAHPWQQLARRSYREDASGIPVLDVDPMVGAALRAAADGPAVDLWPLYAALRTVPVLAIRGALSDILSEATFARMRREKPDLVALSVANRGHVPLLDEPECVAAIDAFLGALQY
jgi:pimeloyl-ACP methyl ester carboxylesterase